MWFYWAMFTVPALASLSPSRLTTQSRTIVIIATAVLMIVIIGLRDHVGADWDGYRQILHQAETQSLPDLLASKEPGFGLLNWVSIQFDWGIYGINFLSAIIFVAGFVAFLSRQSNFWRCLTLSVPILIIQLSMSGIRQAAALGILFFALNAFVDRKPVKYFFLVILAATFHQTAIIFLLFAAFMYGRIHWLAALSAAALALLAIIFLFHDVGFYSKAYIAQDQGAAGAMPRVALNLAATLVFFRYAKTRYSQYNDYRLFGIMATATCIVTPFVPFFQVAVDRIEYYIVPFQIAALSRWPEFVNPRLRMAVLLGIYGGYAAALAVWLNFSLIAQMTWLPYRSVLWTGGG